MPELKPGDPNSRPEEVTQCNIEVCVGVVYGSGIIHAVIPPHLLLSFLLPCFSSLSLLLPLFLVASSISEESSLVEIWVHSRGQQVAL